MCYPLATRPVRKRVRPRAVRVKPCGTRGAYRHLRGQPRPRNRHSGLQGEKGNRADRIRTCDLFVPNEARYQPALQLDNIVGRADFTRFAPFGKQNLITPRIMAKKSPHLTGCPMGASPFARRPACRILRFVHYFSRVLYWSRAAAASTVFFFTVSCAFLAARATSSSLSDSSLLRMFVTHL